MTATTRSEYRLENLSCASCAAKFEKNVQALPNVTEAKVNFGASKLSVVGDVTTAQINQAGAFDGITVAEEKNSRLEKPIPFYKRKENIVTVLSLVFLVIGAILSFMHDETYPPAIVFFAISIAIGGASMFKTGIQNLIRLDFDMKTLMTIAIIGAVIIGEWREGAVIVFLFAVSEALEAYSMNKARQSIQSLMDIAPSSATVRRAGELLTIPTEEILRGDVLLVRPGEKIAMDGTVKKGSSTINQAAITGESVPVLKEHGDEVFAGTLNEEGGLEIEVTKLVQDTALAKIIHLVEEAQAEKAPSQKFVDRFARYYTPAIMVIALLIAVVPPLLGADWNTWVYQGLAVLVVGCPCALVVSTPVAIVTAIGNAARHGVLIKGGIHLEETGRLNAIAFDKTGTLTKGYPEVSDFVIENSTEKQALLRAVSAVESLSQHPLARAIVNYATAEGVGHADVTDFQSVTGKGAYGNVEGDQFKIGSISWIDSFTKMPEEAIEMATALQREGKSVMAIMKNNVYAGLIAVADPIREESQALLGKLKEIGIRHTVMLTGDHEQTGKAIGKALDMTDVRAGLMPEDKLHVIKELQEKYGRVAMVGDGVNDAPALAEASVGIAMGGAGTDAALETADIALMADDLEKLPYTITLSRKTLRIIKENIMFALGLKIIALLLIIPGWLTLWIAIFADMGATILVVLNSLRLIRINK